MHPQSESHSSRDHEEILRLIHNSRREHASCALARGRYGLADYGRLAHLLRKVSPDELYEYLDEIDEVRTSHSLCVPCSMKFLAFCAAYCGDQLPERGQAYLELYYDRLLRLTGDRDFIAEVNSAIASARRLPRAIVTNVALFRS